MPNIYTCTTNKNKCNGQSHIDKVVLDSVDINMFKYIHTLVLTDVSAQDRRPAYCAESHLARSYEAQSPSDSASPFFFFNYYYGVIWYKQLQKGKHEKQSQVTSKWYEKNIDWCACGTEMKEGRRRTYVCGACYYFCRSVIDDGGIIDTRFQVSNWLIYTLTVVPAKCFISRMQSR